MKEVRDNLRSIHEGNDKIRKAKLQMLFVQFETLKRKEEEDVASYFLRVDEIVKSITGLRAIVKEKDVVQKITRTLPHVSTQKFQFLKTEAI